MRIYDTLFPNIKRILDSGKDSVVKDPVQFGLNLKPSSLPPPTLPKTANTSTPQIIAPSVPTPARPVSTSNRPINNPSPINPLDIIRYGKEQVISQGAPQPNKVLTDGFF